MRSGHLETAQCRISKLNVFGNSKKTDVTSACIALHARVSIANIAKDSDGFARKGNERDKIKHEAKAVWID